MNFCETLSNLKATLSKFPLKNLYFFFCRSATSLSSDLLFEVATTTFVIIFDLDIFEITLKIIGFDLILYFGKERYYWTNISKNILNKNSVIILTYNVSGKKIDIYIDNLYKSFNYTEGNLKLGSERMIINKMGNIDMELTQFIYYNKYFTINDVDIYNQVYNYYLNNKNVPFSHRNTEIENLQNTNISLQDKINTLRNKVNQYELK